MNNNNPLQSNFLSYITHPVDGTKPYQNANTSQEFNTSQFLNSSLPIYQQCKVRSSSIKENNSQQKNPSNSSFKDSSKKQPLSSKVKPTKKSKKNDLSLYNQLNKLVRQTTGNNKKDNISVLDDCSKNRSPHVSNSYLKSAKEKNNHKGVKNQKLSNLLKLSFNNVTTNLHSQTGSSQVGNQTATTQLKTYHKNCDNLKEIRDEFKRLYDLKRTPSTSVNASTPHLDSQSSNTKNSPNLNINQLNTDSLLNSHKDQHHHKINPISLTKSRQMTSQQDNPTPKIHSGKSQMQKNQSYMTNPNNLYTSKSQRSLYKTLLPKTPQTSQKLKNWLQNTPAHIVMRFMKDAKFVNEFKQSLQGLIGFVINLKTPYVFSADTGPEQWPKCLQEEVRLVKNVTENRGNNMTKWKELMENKINYVKNQKEL